MAENGITITYGQVTSEDELEQILALQQKNLPQFLSLEEKEREGFVTVCHSFEILQRMNMVCPHIIAKSKDAVVGYALCMDPQFADDIDVLKPMFVEIDALFSNNETYLAMGQICIDKDYRKMGIFRKLYETMSTTVYPTYSLIITEVDALNTRSLNAHYAIGFKELKSYSSGGQDWKLIGLATI